MSIRSGKNHQNVMCSGLRQLRAGHSWRALALFRDAIRHCPPEERSDLSEAFYWLAIASLRVGQDEAAIRALVSSQKARRRGNAQSLYLHLSNEYGMRKGAGEKVDDWKAFSAIHVARYFSARKHARFSSAPERDVVSCLIEDSWKSLLRSRSLEGKTTVEKRVLFERIRIVFPMPFSCPVTMATGARTASTVDFCRGRSLEWDDRCTCGSGIPYGRCCGRIRDPREVASF